MANNNPIATLTTRVQISKQQAFEDFVKIYKDIQKEVDKDAIVYTLKADKSSLKDLLKRLKEENFEIGTDIVLNTKSNDLQSIIEDLFSKATSNADLGFADRIKKELDDVESDIAKKRKRLDELSKAKSSSSDKKRTSSEVMDEIDKTVAYLKKSSTTEKAAERAAKYLMDLYAYMDKIGEKFPKKEEGIYRTIKENYKDFVPGYKGNADNAFNKGKTSANTDKIIKEQKQLLDSIQSLEDKRQELLDQLQSNTSSTVPISENEISATEEESRALDTLIDKIEYLKKIKSESKFMETAEEKLSDMEDKAWDAGGNNPKSEADSLKKIKAYEDLSEHIDKARNELDKFDESYEKVIVTLKNGEQIEIFDSSDLEELSLAKNKIQDIQFVTEELANSISSGKKAFDKVNEIEEWSNANFDKQLFPPTVKYADSIDELQDVLLKIREFKQDLIDINNMDDGTITVARKDELLNTIDYLDTLQQSVQKALDIKKQFEAERKSDSEEKWRNSLATELYHLQEENSSLEMENDSLKSLLSKKDQEGISVKDFYNTYGLPSEALDSNVFSNVREVLDHLGGSFKEINEEAEDFSEIKLNARFLESLIEQLNLSKDELDVIKESLSSIYDIVPGGKYAYLSSPVNNSKQAWNELNKIQSIIEGTHKVSSEEIEHAREMIQLRNEASQIANENQTISNDKSLRELVETLAELKASSSTSEDELNSVKDAIVDILNLDVSKFESFAKILLSLNSNNPLLTDGSRNVEQTIDSLERLAGLKQPEFFQDEAGQLSFVEGLVDSEEKASKGVRELADELSKVNEQISGQMTLDDLAKEQEQIAEIRKEQEKLNEAKREETTTPPSSSTSGETLGDIQKEQQHLTELHEVLHAIIDLVNEKTSAFENEANMVGAVANREEQSLQKVIDALKTIKESIESISTVFANLKLGNEINTAWVSDILKLLKLDGKDFTSIHESLSKLSEALGKLKVKDNSFVQSLNNILDRSKELDNLAKILTQSSQKIKDAEEATKSKEEKEHSANIHKSYEKELQLNKELLELRHKIAMEDAKGNTDKSEELKVRNLSKMRQLEKDIAEIKKRSRNDTDKDERKRIDSVISELKKQYKIEEEGERKATDLKEKRKAQAAEEKARIDDEIAAKKKQEAELEKEKKARDALSKSIDEYLGKLDKVINDNNIQKRTGAGVSSNLASRWESLKKDLSNIDVNADTTKAQEAFNDLKVKIDRALSSKEKKYEKVIPEEVITNLGAQIEDFGAKNTRLTKELSERLEEVRRRYKALLDSGVQGDALERELKSISSELNKIKAEANEAGVAGKNFGHMMLDSLKSANARFIANYLSIQDMIRYARTAFETIHQLDTALVDLKKTTTMSNSELEDFYHNSSRIAKQMGVSSEEIISQASAWSRLGYSSKEAAESMAELSSQFAKISPGTSVEDATDYLVSTMKAFNIDVTNVESDIMDSINRIGNTMATSNQEVGEMLKRSSAAMAAANNSLAETIALESAAVQITRNAETTGINSAA